MARPLGGRRRTEATALPGWIKPQLTKLVDQPPDGPEWLHEIKFDGYRMHARLDGGAVRLLTRTGLDWTHKYAGIAAAVASLSRSARPDHTCSLCQHAAPAPRSGDAFSPFSPDFAPLRAASDRPFPDDDDSR
jgi:hypothetical protein